MGAHSSKGKEKEKGKGKGKGKQRYAISDFNQCLEASGTNDDVRQNVESKSSKSKGKGKESDAFGDSEASGTNNDLLQNVEPPIPLTKNKYRFVTNSSRYKFVVAIDFGTTFSGYAYSAYEGTDIVLNKNWSSGFGFVSLKTPTCVLTKDDRFEKFGYEALRTFYAMSMNERKEKDYKLFKYFKMALFDGQGLHEITEDLHIDAVDGQRRKAMDIVAQTLSYLKEQAIQAITRSNGSNFNTDDILWVQSVPIIWSDKGKHFMRKAAYKAGIAGEHLPNNLVISLEPEAAAIYCQNQMIGPFPERCIVIDAGGGTVDVTAYKVDLDMNLREIFPASGGPWGGAAIDDLFQEKLREGLGREFLTEYSSKHGADWLNIEMRFQNDKLGVSLENDLGIRVNIPGSFAHAYETKFPESSFVQTINRCFASSENQSTKDNIIIEYRVAKDMFERVIDKIVNHVERLLHKPALKDIQHIFLVGGFGQCELLRIALENRLLIHVLNIDDTQTAVLKGSVIFGKNPQSIKCRLMQGTYGFAICFPFNERQHTNSKRLRVDGKSYCKDCFRVIIGREESVEEGDVRQFSTRPLNKHQKSIRYRFYYTENDNPKYVDDTGVRYVGDLTLDISDTSSDSNRIVQVEVYFGSTEFIVEAKEISREGSKPVNCRFDFLRNVHDVENDDLCAAIS